MQKLQLWQLHKEELHLQASVQQSPQWWPSVRREARSKGPPLRRPGLRGTGREERDQQAGARQTPVCTGRVLRKERASSVCTRMVRLER